MTTDSTTGRMIIVGAGNWGTTLAALYASRCPVVLWAQTDEHASEIQRSGRNERYLPSLELPESLEVERFLASEIAPEDLVVIAVPSHAVRETAQTLAPFLDRHVVVNAAKGFDHGTMKTMGEVLQETFPRAGVVTLSGPNIAREIAEGRPARAVLAGTSLGALSRAFDWLQHERFTLETSRDQRGVELCASLKGILAIAVGLADGFGLGDNFSSLLITYGLREFTTMTTFMGASERVVVGIAGLGDLITSSLSPAGRNRKFGRLLAEGLRRDEALARVGMVVEGVEMLKTVRQLEKMNVPLPLFAAVRRIVEGNASSARDELITTVLQYGSAISAEQTLNGMENPHG